MSTSDPSREIDIFPLRYKAADLAAAAEDDAVFFLMCGQLHNDIVILMRQMLQAYIHESDPEPQRIATSTAHILNMRLLVGRLAEGWPLIRDRFRAVLRDYGDAIDDNAKVELRNLTRYFSDTNLMREMRNKVAAHLDQDFARAAYRKLDPEEPLIDFHAATEGNTIFFSAQALMLSSMHQLKGNETVEASFALMNTEVLAVASQLGNVIRSYLIAFCKRHLRQKLVSLGAERIVVQGQSTLEEFRVPVYLAHAPGPRKARPLPPQSD